MNIQPTGALGVGTFNKHEYQYATNVEYLLCLGSNITAQAVSVGTLPIPALCLVHWSVWTPR